MELPQNPKNELQPLEIKSTFIKKLVGTPMMLTYIPLDQLTSLAYKGHKREYDLQSLSTH
jgi:hypothetical protein